jgi:hypothetical protein
MLIKLRPGDSPLNGPAGVDPVLIKDVATVIARPQN